MNDNSIGRSITKEEYDAFRAFLEKASGIVLGDSKQYLVSSRLNNILDRHRLKTFGDLVKSLNDNRISGLKDEIVDAMTTNETLWFRDGYPYEALKDVILPEYAKVRDRPLRIWSSACSSGQEPYSISMITQEFLMANPGAIPHGVQIVATDISQTMLDLSKTGKYDETSMDRGVSEERRRRFFTRTGNAWEIRQEIKNRVSFRLMNLQTSYAQLGKFDIIFCRNVLIYFSSESKTDILERMGDALLPNGYLILGSSEAPTRYTNRYNMTRLTQGVIYRNKA